MQITIKLERGSSTPHAGARRRRGIVTVLLAGALLLPGIVLAADSFADVPSTNPFHADIERDYAARITAGCGDGNYCPTANVTRQQMAAFLNRVGSRAGYAVTGWQTVPDAEADLAVLTIKAGNVTGGTAFAVVNAAITTYATTATGCPCQALFIVTRDGGGTSNYAYTQVNEVTGSLSFDSASLTLVIAVPTGVTQTFRIRGYRLAGTATINARVDASAIYTPFGNLGGSTLSATTSGQPSSPSGVGPR